MRKFLFSLFLAVIVVPSFAWNSKTEIRNYYTNKINALVDKYDNLKRLKEQEGSAGPYHIQFGIESQIIPQQIDDLKAEMNDEINKFRSNQKKQVKNKNNNSSSSKRPITGTTVKGKEKRMQEINDYYDNLKREAQEKERLRREEEVHRRQAKYEKSYHRQMASSETSYQRNLSYADSQRENMQYLYGAKLDNIEVQPGYVASSDGSTMTVQKRSKAGILPSKNKNSSSIDGMIPIAQKANLETSRLESLLVLGGGDYDNVEREIRKMFYEQTGCSVKMLSELEKRPKSELTENEKKILENYEQFSKDCYNHMRKSAVEDERKRETDMAIIAQDVYYDSKHNYVGKKDSLGNNIYTDYKRINTNSIPKDDPFYTVALELERQTNESTSTGFMASIYKNDKTGAYAISFQGTVPGNSVNTDVEMALDKVTEQDKSAISIGKVLAKLPDTIKVNLTGHSLGGRLASIAGLESGRPTVTINAAGVSDANLKEMGLLSKKNSHNYNIKAIVSADDMLNAVQKIGEKVNIGPGTALGDKMIIGTEENIKKAKDRLKATMIGVPEVLVVSAKEVIQNTEFAEKNGIKFYGNGVSSHGSLDVAAEMVNANRQAQKKWDNWWKINEAKNKK